MYKKTKKEIREKIWKKLEEKGIVTFPRPPRGRIPNFVGAEKAALNLMATDEWKNAKIIKINPDSPQKPLRELALREGKTLIVATPRLKEGFILLSPREIPSYFYKKASTIRGMFSLGRKISLNELRKYKIDLVITGSVAVDRKGHRLGKGEGYAELEYAILREIGAVTDKTPIATTVHDIQVVDKIPRDEYDLIVDIIATPNKIIKVNSSEEKPKGIYWDKLDCNKIKEIPLLVEIAKLYNPEKLQKCFNNT